MVRVAAAVGRGAAGARYNLSGCRSGEHWW